MRCSAIVHPSALTLRSRMSSQNLRCLRQAVTGGMCRQHSEMKWCQHPGCDRSAKLREAGRWVCRIHAPLWRAHQQIVNRILAIHPARKRPGAWIPGDN